jgi:hypothetical protein
MYAQVETQRAFPGRPTPVVPRGRPATIAAVGLLQEAR